MWESRVFPEACALEIGLMPFIWKSLNRTYQTSQYMGTVTQTLHVRWLRNEGILFLFRADSTDGQGDGQPCLAEALRNPDPFPLVALPSWDCCGSSCMVGAKSYLFWVPACGKGRGGGDSWHLPLQLPSLGENQSLGHVEQWDGPGNVVPN